MSLEERFLVRIKEDEMDKGEILSNVLLKGLLTQNMILQVL